MSKPRRVVLLGSTGSIGTQALDVIRSHRDEYEVIALATGRNAELLAAQAREFGVPADRALLAGERPEALEELASLPEADVVLNGVVGFAGLPATIAALRAGKRLPVLVRGRWREQRNRLARHRILPLLERRDVHNPDRPPVRGGDELMIARMNLEVVHRRGRQRGHEALPTGAAIE